MILENDYECNYYHYNPAIFISINILLLLITITNNYIIKSDIVITRHHY